MKIIKAILLILWLIFAVTSESSAQRNRIMYRPFDWQAIEIKNDSLTYAIYFPKGMEEVAALAQNEIEKIIPFYAQQAFVSDWPIADTSIISYKLETLVGTTPGTTIKDSLTKKPLIIKKAWQPQNLIILLYPNNKDFNQQQIIDEFIPPGVGGFTESQRKRIAIPYGGDQHFFRLVLAHEITHAFVMHYFTERGVSNTRLGNIVGFGQEELLPLWLSEGLAEFLAFQFLNITDSHPRAIQHKEFTLFNILSGAIPASYNTFAERDDFAVYALGYTFVKYLLNDNRKKITVLFDNVIFYRDFKKAWFSTFGKNIQESYNEWYAMTLASSIQATLLSPADNAIKDSVTSLFPSIPAEPIFWSSSANYDPISEITVGYEYDKKWGANIIALVNGQKVFVAHQFENKSLFLKTYNPPAISGRTIAVVLDKDGADKIHLYDIVGDNPPKARLREIIDLPNKLNSPIVLIEDLYFANTDNYLLFIGTDVNGQKNVYTYDNARRIIWRHTNDIWNEENPLIVNIKGENNITYLRSAEDYHKRFCYEDSGKIYVAKIGDENYLISRVVSKKSTLYFQIVNPDGASDILIWNMNNPRAYRFRYGVNILNITDKKFTRGRLIEQLVGISKNDELIVALNQQQGIPPQIRFVKFAVDTSKLEKIPIVIEQKEKEKKALYDTVGLSKQIKKVAKFPFLAISGKDNSITFNNPTGEQNLSVYGMFYRNEIIGSVGYGIAYYENRSQRLFKGIIIEGGKYFNIHLPLWVITNSVSFDKTFSATGIIRWPFNLEQSLTGGFGIGYLDRSYLFQPQNNFSSPTLRSEILFTDDASFPDYLRGSNHGHWYRLRIYQTSALLKNRPNILDGAVEMDLRYYLRPWQAHAHFAFRLRAGKNFGKDPYAFIDTDLHRIPGFNLYLFNTAKSIGENMIVYQIEYRLPLTRVLFLDYTFWENETQKPFILSVIPTAFLYGGGLSWNEKPINFAHRYGLAVKIGFTIPYTYLRFEHYKFMNENQWRDAMTIGIDY